MMESVLDVVTESADKAGATAIREIHLCVGEMTEAIQECLEFAFEALAPGTPCENAKLDITYVGPHSRCLSCGEEFDHDRFHMSCPLCGSTDTELLRGRDLYIDSIEVELPDDEDGRRDTDDASSRQPGTCPGAGDANAMQKETPCA